MTTTSTTRSARRKAKTVAAGAVALTAAVALPAFAIDRGGDGTVDVSSAGAAAEISTTTTSTIDPQVAAWLDAGGGEWIEEQALARVTTWIESLTPDQKFEILAADLSPEERAATRAFLEEQGRATLRAFFADIDAQKAAKAAEAAKAAKAAKAAAAAAASAARPAVSTSTAGGSVWDRLAQCEAGGNWAYPTVAGGYSGGLMFHYATWNANGGQAYAATASGATREQQITVAERVLANSGWGAWPGCSRKLGLR